MKINTVIYGSMATGLALEQSDLDIAIFGLKIIKYEELIYYIDLLEKQLKIQNFIISCESIKTARVPVIKLVFFSLIMKKKLIDLSKLDLEIKYSGNQKNLKMDLIFDTQIENYSATFYAVQSVELIIRKVNLFSYLKTIIILAKRLLYHYQLNIPYFGIFLAFP